jgi:hypothetical protein
MWKTFYKMFAIFAPMKIKRRYKALTYPFDTVTKRTPLTITFDVTDKAKRDSVGNAARQYAKRVGKLFTVVTIDSGMKISQI